LAQGVPGIGLFRAGVYRDYRPADRYVSLTPVWRELNPLTRQEKETEPARVAASKRRMVKTITKPHFHNAQETAGPAVAEHICGMPGS